MRARGLRLAALTGDLRAQVRGKEPTGAVHLLVAATAVLRCDLVLLLAPVSECVSAAAPLLVHSADDKRTPQMGLHLLLTRQLSLAHAVLHGLVPAQCSAPLLPSD